MTTTRKNTAGPRPGPCSARPPPTTDLYTFWSDQYEHKIEYVGHVTSWDEFVVRGSVEEGKLIGFYLVDGEVRAAVGLDRGGDPELDLDGEMAASARLVRPGPGRARGARRRPDRSVVAALGWVWGE